MKKNIKMAAVACMLLSAFATVSCDKNTDNGGENPPQGETFELGDGSKDNFEIASDMTLTYPNVYTLKGFVYVPDGVTLTIEPGVVIKGDKATQGTLIIERGGKIMAQGTPERPIVFTSAQAPGSRKPGDWGGIILLGKAPNNLGEQTIEGGVRSKHGGNDPADNSGVLSYVRVEFPGIEYSTDNEINGITFGSVGSGTKIDHLQVSYSGDDSYEWFGGTANAKYLVAYSGWDDDFDTDNGFSGKVQFAMGVRNPRIGDKSASNGFESDNNGDGAATEPYTSCVFANVSLFGPVSNPASYTEQAGAEGSPVDARFQAALHLRRNTQLSIYNSLIAAFPVGLIIENDKGSTTQDWAEQGKLNVTNCVMAGMVKNYQDAQYWKDGSQFDDEDAGSFADGYFNRAEGGNRVFAALSDLGLSGNPGSAFPLRWSSPAATVRLLRVLHGRRRRWLRASIKWTISVLSVRMRPLPPTGRAAGAISTPRIRFTKRRQVGQFVGGRAVAAVRPFPVPRRSFRCAGNACGDCVPCRNITARGLRQSRPP